MTDMRINDFMDVADRHVTVNGFDIFFTKNFRNLPLAVVANDDTVTMIDVSHAVDTISDDFGFIAAVSRSFFDGSAPSFAKKVV